MYKCKYFEIYELVTPQMYEAWGEKCWQLFDERVLITLDALRKKFGSCVVNDWKWGGRFDDSGFRDVHFYSSVDAYLKSRSQHKYGRAVDAKFKVPAHEVRKYILENPDEFPHVKFIEVGPLKDGSDMSWVHIDVRNGDLLCWSPLEGVVSKEDVIRRKL
ncbi:hypothetical protein VPHK567_0346 [Vibrio phage K567]|nr:peptidase_M15_3 domain-containing protein [Vibrio phage 6E35.1a]